MPLLNSNELTWAKGIVRLIDFVIAFPANTTRWFVIAKQPVTFPDLAVGGSH